MSVLSPGCHIKFCFILFEVSRYFQFYQQLAIFTLVPQKEMYLKCVHHKRNMTVVQKKRNNIYSENHKILTCV